jgi:hypothetical protein
MSNSFIARFLLYKSKQFQYSEKRRSDLALVKFDENGNLEWNITWGGILEDQGNDIAIDTAGNIYCSGFTESYGEGEEDFVLFKVFPNKTKSWFHTWGGNNTDKSEGLVLDVNNSIYSVGWTQSYCKGAVDFAVLKYDSDGNLAWNISWGDWEVDTGAGIGIDSTGDIYCTGYSNLPDDDLVLVKFGPGSETTTIIPGFNILYLIFGFIFGILIIFPLFRRKNRPNLIK